MKAFHTFRQRTLSWKAEKSHKPDKAKYEPTLREPGDDGASEGDIMQYLQRRGSRRESNQLTDNMSKGGLGKSTKRSPIRHFEEVDDKDDRNSQRNTSDDHGGLLALQRKRTITSGLDKGSMTTLEGQPTVSGLVKRSELVPQGYKPYKKSSGSTSALVEGSSSLLKSPQPKTMRLGLAEFRQDLLNQQSNAQLEAPCQLHFQNVFSDFFSKELELGDRLWDLVTLCGDPSAIVDEAGLSGGVSALTCGEYVEQRWPESSIKIAEMFHTIETKWSATGVTHQLSRNSSTFGSLQFSRTNSLTDTALMLLKGSPTEQADLGEAFLWLCTVIRTVEESDSPVASTLHLDKSAQGKFWNCDQSVLPPPSPFLSLLRYILKLLASTSTVHIIYLCPLSPIPTISFTSPGSHYHTCC